MKTFKDRISSTTNLDSLYRELKSLDEITYWFWYRQYSREIISKNTIIQKRIADIIIEKQNRYLLYFLMYIIMVYTIFLLHGLV